MYLVIAAVVIIAVAMWLSARFERSLHKNALARDRSRATPSAG